MCAWQVWDSGVASAEENMRIDATLLEEAATLGGPLLHFYEWRGPSATYGHFSRPEQWINLEQAHLLGLDLARRPTGGGIVFHLFDMAFSVVVPAHSPLYSTNTLDNYAWVNRAVLRSVKEFLGSGLELMTQESLVSPVGPSSFCMARPTRYDVVWQGKKVAGAAQRKTRQGFLHQGTIALVMPSASFLSKILLQAQVKEAMLEVTLPLLGEGATEEDRRCAKHRLRLLLQRELSEGISATCQDPGMGSI